MRSSRICRTAANWAVIAWFGLAGGGIQAAEPLLGHAVFESGEHVFSAFTEWTQAYLAASATPDPDMLAKGRALAVSRRAALYQLIQTEPARALAKALPTATRKRLPAEVSELLEENLSGIGDYVVTCAFPASDSVRPARVQRNVQIGGRVFTAFVYGRRTEQMTKYEIPVHGMAIDGVLALSENVLRRLERGEEPAANQRGSVSGNGGGVWAEAGKSVMRFESEAEMERKEAELRGCETGADSRSASFSDRAPNGDRRSSQVWTNVSKQIGDKRVLVIRVDFEDLPGDPHSGLYTAGFLQKFADSELSPFFQRISYGVSAITFTVTTNLYRMPEPATQYLGKEPMMHLAATRLAAEDYDLRQFDRFIVVFSSLSDLPGSSATYGGLAEIGGERIWINGEFTFRVLVHELGHSFGLPHANLWQVNDGAAVSQTGWSLEYADPFDGMGANFADHHGVDYNPLYKLGLGWIGEDDIQTIVTSGTNRVFAFDAGVAKNKPLALKVVRDSERSYWISYRVGFPDNTSLSPGAYVLWGYQGNRSTDLLDATTPGVDPRDAGLGVGRHLFDHVSGMSLSVIRAGGTTSGKYLEVSVRFGNTPPVITGEPRNVLATAGQSFVVAVAADGIPAPGYQWQRQRAGTTDWEDLAEGEETAGCQSPLLVVRKTSPAMRGDKFRCVVSNSEGSAASMPAVLDVRVNGAFVLAGEPGQYGNVDGASSAARFAYPSGLAVDLNGDFYVADNQGQTIRKVSAQGGVTTFAGQPGFRGYKDGPVLSAQFDWPRGVAIGGDGTLYVTEHGNSVVRSISTDGDVSTLAGEPGKAGTRDGPGAAARFRCPWGIAVDKEGTVFVSDLCDNTVRRITPGGVVSTLAGLAGVRGTEDGPGSVARFRDPSGLAVDGAGNVYVADLGNSTVRKITPEGFVSTVAGVPQSKGRRDGPADQALFNAPAALAIDHASNIYVADKGNNNVRKISWDRKVSTIVGTENDQYPPLFAAEMRHPSGVAIAPGGLYVADTENQVIWWIVLPPEPPVLQIVRKEQGIQLSWPSASGDYVLEAAESFGPSVTWVAQPLSIEPSAHRGVVELPMSSAARLFRLRSR